MEIDSPRMGNLGQGRSTPARKYGDTCIGAHIVTLC